MPNSAVRPALRLHTSDAPLADPRGRVIRVTEYRVRGAEVYVAVDPTGEFVAYELARDEDEREQAVARLWRLLSSLPVSGPTRLPHGA